MLAEAGRAARAHALIHRPPRTSPNQDWILARSCGRSFCLGGGRPDCKDCAITIIFVCVYVHVYMYTFSVHIYIHTHAYAYRTCLIFRIYLSISTGLYNSRVLH